MKPKHVLMYGKSLQLTRIKTGSRRYFTVVHDEEARQQLISLERLRCALATTKAQADELHVRVVELLERSVADDTRAAERQPPKRKT